MPDTHQGLDSAASDLLSRPFDLHRVPRLDVKAMPAVLSRLTKLIFRYPWRGALAIACALGAAILNLVTPHLLGSAVDLAHGLQAAGASGNEGVREGLVRTALLIVAAATVRGVLNGIQGYQGEYLAQRVGYDLRMAFFDKLQVLSFSYHDLVHSGELITRGMLDLEGVRAFMETGVLRLVTLTLLVGVGTWRVLHTDMVTGALALSFIPFVIWRATRLGAHLRLSWMRLQELMGLLTRTMEESLQGVRVVRAFAGRDFELAKFDQAGNAALKMSNRRITLRTGAITEMNLTYYASMGLVLLVGGGRVAHGQLTVGALTEILTFMTILQLPVRQVSMIVNASARATSSGARLFQVLDKEPEICDRPDAKDLMLTRGVLRFEHVSFAYDERGPTLQDISFEVTPGRTLGIVGPPGSGKSTIAQLIPRLYDVGSGRVTIDGQDVRDVTLQSLRKAVALVQQDVFLFDASIHDNVAYAEPEAERDEVIEAASIAQIHNRVVQLPEGYRTQVGERGVALSGGQRQRLSIARGLAANPSIIIFDDSTAAIDGETERRVRAELKRSIGHKTTIIIAHRLSSLSSADEILMLAGGRIVERGTHAQLVAADGAYAALWQLQAETAATPPLAADLERIFETQT